MNKGYSVTIFGILVAAIPQALDLLNGTAGTSFTQACLSEVWVNGVSLVGIVIAYIGRLRQGDVNVLGFRKY